TCAFLVSEKLSAVDCRSRDPETRLKRFRVRQNKKTTKSLPVSENHIRTLLSAFLNILPVHE
ncbi:hypothetical protein, partial [Escherichia coli]|uniref:hypothetical protein n=1 Tax=Escherichia coli TaxID=562 RepID=UPI001BDC93DA